MDDVLLQLARQSKERYYGKYRAFVTDNKDPEKLGRVRLKVPSVLGDEETGWATPCVPFGGAADRGFFAVPDVSAQVWAEFEEGNINSPIWTGAFWATAADVPKEAAKSPPTARVFKTTAGHVLLFEDEQGKEKFQILHPVGTSISIDEKGTVKIVDAKNNTLTLDSDKGSVNIEEANGNKVTMASSGTIVEDSNSNRVEMASGGITIKAQKVVLDASQVALGGQGGEPVIKGQSFLTLFATHVHPSAMGPTGPPTPQGEMNTLSQKVMTA